MHKVQDYTIFIKKKVMNEYDNLIVFTQCAWLFLRDQECLTSTIYIGMRLYKSINNFNSHTRKYVILRRQYRVENYNKYTRAYK